MPLFIASSFENILQCANWCEDLGIPEISVYTFNPSIFKYRSGMEETFMAAFSATVDDWIQDCESYNKKLVTCKLLSVARLVPSTHQ